MKKLLQFLLLSFGILLFKYLFSVMVGYIFPTYTSQAILNNSTQIENDAPKYKLSEIWNKQHSVFYIDIAVNGYHSDEVEEGAPVNWSFYPLYPSLIGGFVKVFPIFHSIDAYYVIGALLSALFFGFALFYLDKLLEMMYLLDDKKYFVYLLLFTFPGSFVFGLVYSESLFLFLTVLGLWLLFTKKYPLAFAVLGLTILTRFIGIVLLVPFIYHFAVQERFNRRVKLVPKAVTYSVIATLPTMLFYYHLFTKTGDFLAAFKGQGNVLGFMYLPLGYFFNYFQKFGLSFHPVYSLNLVVLVMALAAAIYIFIRLFLAFEYRSIEQSTLFVLLAVYVLVLSALSAEAPMLRYLSVCVPLFILLSSVTNMFVRSNTFLSAVLVSLSLQILYFVMFLVGIPVYL